MKEHSPSDRVQLRGQHELMHPGSCALCGSGNCEQGYVDPGIYYDYEGQMYFCVTCVEEMAGVINCLTADETLHLQSLNEQVAEQNASLTKDLEYATARLLKYDDLFSERLGAIAAANANLNADPADEIAQAASESDDEPVNESGVGESVTAEPVASRGKPHGPAQSKRRNITDSTGFSV